MGMARAAEPPIFGGMTSPTDPRSFLYRDTLDPDAALRLTANALAPSTPMAFPERDKLVSEVTLRASAIAVMPSVV